MLCTILYGVPSDELTVQVVSLRHDGRKRVFFLSERGSSKYPFRSPTVTKVKREFTHPSPGRVLYGFVAVVVRYLKLSETPLRYQVSLFNKT